MKLTEVLFWLTMAAIATFYVVKGNDMHAKRAEEMKIKQKDINRTSEN